MSRSAQGKHTDAHNGARAASQATGSVADAAVDASGTFAETLAHEVRSTLEEHIVQRQHSAGSYIRSISTAVQEGSSSLERDGHEATAGCARDVGASIARVADRIDGVDIASTTRRIEDTIRARPVVAMGAAALLGFAAYRLLQTPMSRHESGGS